MRDTYKETDNTYKHTHTHTHLCHGQFLLSSPQVLSHGVDGLLILLGCRGHLLSLLPEGGDLSPVALYVVLQHLISDQGKHQHITLLSVLLGQITTCD